MKKIFKNYAIKGGEKCSALRAWRIRKGLHASDVARSLGVCPAAVSFYERGIEAPRPGMMKKIVLLTRGAVKYEDMIP